MTQGVRYGELYHSLHFMVVYSPMFESMSVMPYLPYAPYLAIILFVYFFPTYLAYVTNHKQRGAIAFTNFMLGWAVVPWFGMIIWALDS